MKMSEAVEIKEVIGVDAVNEALNDGWRLIGEPVPMDSSMKGQPSGVRERPVFCYTLGKPRTPEPQLFFV